MKAILFLVTAAVVGGLVFYGCNGADKGTTDQVDKQAQGAWDTTKKAVQNGAKVVQKMADQSEETMKVKGPIDASKDIDSSSLSVETIGKTVTISGTVPTQEEKEKVHKMAEANVDSGYTIEDNLKVAPKQADGNAKSGSNPPITDDQKP